jgi:hypothetical protein
MQLLHCSAGCIYMQLRANVQYHWTSAHFALVSLSPPPELRHLPPETHVVTSGVFYDAVCGFCIVAQVLSPHRQLINGKRTITLDELRTSHFHAPSSEELPGTIPSTRNPFGHFRSFYNPVCSFCIVAEVLNPPPHMQTCYDIGRVAHVSISPPLRNYLPPETHLVASGVFVTLYAASALSRRF